MIQSSIVTKLHALEKSMLTDYIGVLSLVKLKQLRSALAVAFDIEDDADDDTFEPT